MIYLILSYIYKITIMLLINERKNMITIEEINEDGSLQDLKGIKGKERKVIEEARKRVEEYDKGTGHGDFQSTR